MIFEIIKGQGYQKRIPLGNGLYAQIRRTEAEKLVIDVPYQGVYGLGEKFDSVNQKGPAVYSIQFTHLLDCLVTEPQRKPKTTHHLQQRIIIADEIDHLISWLIFL